MNKAKYDVLMLRIYEANTRVMTFPSSVIGSRGWLISAWAWLVGWPAIEEISRPARFRRCEACEKVSVDLCGSRCHS